jgi:three-Cys-motif partner protein
MDVPEINNLDPKLQSALDRFPDLQFDLVGKWTLQKEKLLAYYMQIYQEILSRVRDSRNARRFTTAWIDTCCSSGIHRCKETEQLMPGSAYIAKQIKPPFDEYYFIDVDEQSLEFLRELIGTGSNMHYYNGDCAVVLPIQLLNTGLFDYDKFRKGLCFVDPYGLDIQWAMIEALGNAGKSNNGKGTVECFINYPQHDIQRNVFRSSPDQIPENHEKRMSRFWGDSSWKEVIYKAQPTLFGEVEERTTKSGKSLLDAFILRLKTKAGFKHVAGPLPLKNSLGVTIFYILFATNNDTAIRAANGAFKKFNEN